jgi:murein DD-endopeptidase MepM/ murein hydrolase activator NlpD
MMFAVISWLALAAGVPVNAVQSDPVAGATAGPPGAALPSGSSDEFRRRMLDWSAPAQAVPLRIRESRGYEGAARFDRLTISSRFGWRSDPITGVGRRHGGIDLPGRFGAAVMATAPGIVRIAGWAGGYGNLVEIEHSDGVRTRYGHLSRLDVFPSEHVEEGQVIGEVGSTGHSTGPHLHYEVRIGGMAVDPLTFVGQRAPAYETIWGSELRATPKRAGWSETSGRNLPEASLR